MRLDICGRKFIEDAGPDEVRAGIDQLENGLDEEAGYLVLQRGPEDFLQVLHEEDGGYHIEYLTQAYGLQRLLNGPLTREELLRALFAYAARLEDWDEGLEWESVSGEQEPSGHQGMECFGAFDPMLARPILEEMERLGLPFEIAVDDGIAEASMYGSYGANASVTIWVPPGHFEAVRAIVLRV